MEEKKKILLIKYLKIISKDANKTFNYKQIAANLECE